MDEFNTTWGLLRAHEITVRDLIGDWWKRLVCRVRGHDWQPECERAGDATYIVGYWCRRCWASE